MWNRLDLRHARRPQSQQALLALHSSGSSGRQWEPYRALLPAGTRLRAPDLIGYGDGPAWPLGASVTLEAEAQRLARWLPHGPGGVHLVGHSYGGAVALELAFRWPERVRSLTLYEPVRFAMLRADGDGSQWRDIVQVGRDIGALTLTGRIHEAGEVFVDYWSGPGAWTRLSPARRNTIAVRMPKVRAEFEALFSDDAPPKAFHRLAMPVRLLCGSRSPRAARRVVELLGAACPAATTTCMEGLGHMGPLEAPARLIDQFAWCGDAEVPGSAPPAHSLSRNGNGWARQRTHEEQDLCAQ
ncbi:alpha/beta fold hydrolase [Piscinibacter sp.]|uniref:alpha/beta fold hydrolase n=1 Tax=Piscinibacter sp. TaxID=1903157 RepID=UPI002BCCC5A7|nr:alpha/beta hydrolase [Albitalea sp.]HUG23730.1 alpha/beta hydrolase [Albitalea sp.]